MYAGACERAGDITSPPLECVFGYIPFLKRSDTVRYSEIQRDTADTVDIAGFSEIYKYKRYRAL